MTTAVQSSSTTSAPAVDPGTLAKEKAALQKLVAQYTQKVSQGTAASALASLAKTIKAEAKALGVNVTLPKAPAAAATAVANAVPVAPAPTASSQGGAAQQVNLVG
jgi:peptidoglycan hydrolase CwlO-like protein